MVFQKCVLDRTRKRNREIMHKDKKDSELIEEYYNMYEQKIFRMSYWEINGRQRRRFRKPFFG